MISRCLFDFSWQLYSGGFLRLWLIYKCFTELFRLFLNKFLFHQMLLGHLRLLQPRNQQELQRFLLPRSRKLLNLQPRPRPAPSPKRRPQPKRQKPSPNRLHLQSPPPQRNLQLLGASLRRTSPSFLKPLLFLQPANLQKVAPPRGRAERSPFSRWRLSAPRRRPSLPCLLLLHQSLPAPQPPLLMTLQPPLMNLQPLPRRPRRRNLPRLCHQRRPPPSSQPLLPYRRQSRALL